MTARARKVFRHIRPKRASPRPLAPAQPVPYRVSRYRKPDKLRYRGAPEPMRKTLLALALFALPVAAVAQTKIAATPAMGWNSWNHFPKNVPDKDVRTAADELVST